MQSRYDRRKNLFSIFSLRNIESKSQREVGATAVERESKSVRRREHVRDRMNELEIEKERLMRHV